MTWARITDPDHAAELLPTWFSGRINVAHVIALVEFVAAELVESPGDLSIPTDREGPLPIEYERLGTVPAPVVVS
jgi:hypothetical protein